MKKLIHYAIFIYLFVIHLNSFADAGGYIWIPLAWTFSYNKNNSDGADLKFKSVKLVFHNIKSNKNLYSTIKYTDKKNNTFKINNKFNEKTLFSQKLIKIPVGKYSFDGAAAEIIDKNNEIVNVNFKLLSPFAKEKGKSINFVVSQNNISPFPAMSIETNLGFKNRVISQFSKIDFIEDEYILVNEIFTQIKSIKKLIIESKIGFINANDQFPPLQIMGTSIKSLKSNYIGLIIDISCDIKGNLKFVWINKNDALQYVFYNNLTNKKESCKIHKSFPVKFYLPNGSWVLQSMTLNIPNKKNRDFYTWSLLNKDKSTKKYFNLSDKFFSYLNIKERALLKFIQLNLTGNIDQYGLYFLGSSEIKKNTPSIKMTDDLSFYFKRNYEIVDIKKLFSVKKVYNAYTGELMKKDRIIGDIQLKVSLLGNEKSQGQLSIYLQQIKTYATTELASCVAKQEIFDPLLILNGTISIQNNHNRTRYIDISKKDFNFNGKGFSQSKIIDCMEEKLKSFKFSRSFNTPFRAKILFESF